jgi:N-acyl amino acid synthase of PEP-CTERM/exosortase system
MKQLSNNMFDKHFEVVLADNHYSRSLHYQLRYQVYCLEEGFENAAKFCTSEERDAWDDQSAHFLVRSKQTDEWVAAMRMVIPKSGPLPIEGLCDIHPVARPSLTGEPAAEISRICVVNSYRRKSSQQQSRMHKSIIMKGLLSAAAQYSQENGILYWYFLTSPALARIFSFLNIQLIKVGAACEHRGTRYPFLADLKQAIEQAKQGCPDLASMLNNNANAYKRFSELGWDQESIPAYAKHLAA